MAWNLSIKALIMRKDATTTARGSGALMTFRTVNKGIFSRGRMQGRNSNSYQQRQESGMNSPGKSATNGDKT